jgi:hypothetical protein
MVKFAIASLTTNIVYGANCMSIGPQNGLTPHEHAAQEVHLKAARWSNNAKKATDVLKDTIIGTSMHGKGVGLEGDDCPCTTKPKLYDGNSHCLNKSMYMEKDWQMNLPPSGFAK